MNIMLIIIMSKEKNKIISAFKRGNFYSLIDSKILQTSCEDEKA